jgi:hypothetical protein
MPQNERGGTGQNRFDEAAIASAMPARAVAAG